MFLLIKFNDRLAFPVIRSMWEFQDRPLEISAPKYFALVTTSRTWPCNLYTMLIDFLAVVTRTIWHLEGLNSMSHRPSHTVNLSRSFVAQFHHPSLQLLDTRSSRLQTSGLGTTTHPVGHLHIQKTGSAPRLSPWVSHRSLGPSLIPRPQGPPSVTGYPGRPGSRIVRFLLSHTGGASREA